jgi:NAD(P)H-hydrate epimerase
MDFKREILRNLYFPPKESHKGQNGKLLIIGGSQLFHGASFWALKVASRIVDMVFYSSIPQNNEIVKKLKEKFWDCIVVPRNKVEDYIQEADCILIGPGLPRKEGEEKGDDDTEFLTRSLLEKYPDKKWVIDGGSLQTIDPEIIPKSAILTPHRREFEILIERISDEELREMIKNLTVEDQVENFSKHFNCIVLLKGVVDIVCSPQKCEKVAGGNPGMTKGGTGDVLAGLVAALYCKNDAFLSAISASFINKKAGDFLYQKFGPYFNASDLADAIPVVMKDLVGR